MTTIAIRTSAVDQFHALLIDEFGELLDGRLKILATGELGESAWRKTGARGPVVFEMVSTDEAIAKISKRFNAHAIPLVAADQNPQASEGAWIGWQETWEKIEQKDEMKLQSANMTFIWGSRSSMLAVFRADWDQKGCGTNTAGHPHWQFPDTIVERVHFCMAGWSFSNKSPQCWQHYPDDCQGILEWAKRTLEYSRSQLVAHPL